MIDLYPAIDLLGGRVVRLRQGDYADETVYGDDPVAVAAGFAASGATWIHVVDLDAARSGDPVNRSVVAAIAAAVADTARVQTGGGVRTNADAQQLATAGVSRVVMGSAAVRDPDLVKQVSEIIPVAVGLDHRDGELSIHGWTKGSGVRLHDSYERFPTADVFVITDIGRDGMLTGPDIEGLTKSAQMAGSPVIASGGVSSLADVVALAEVENLGGIITGKAVYEGRFSVSEALDALAAADADEEAC